jgi:hypothetical protein
VTPIVRRFDVIVMVIAVVAVVGHRRRCGLAAPAPLLENVVVVCVLIVLVAVFLLILLHLALGESLLSTAGPAAGPLVVQMGLALRARGTGLRRNSLHLPRFRRGGAIRVPQRALWRVYFLTGA